MKKKNFTKFSGNCSHWPQFKKDLEKQVSNTITADATYSYALRNALPDHIRSLVSNMSDDIKELLDERFGDAGEKKTFKGYQVIQTRQGSRRKTLVRIL